jgi:hypothetical protein
MKTRIIDKALMMASLLKAGHVTVVTGEIRRWLFSDSVYYGLCRERSMSCDTPRAKMPLTVRPLEERDIPSFLGTDTQGVTGEGSYFRLRGLSLLKAGIGTCYVAIESNGSPRYMQWLIDAKDNGKIHAYFKGIFPWLGPGEALVENVFTHESYRGLGIMPDALSQLWERDATLNVRRMVAFVDSKNTSSLKGFKKAGFLPYVIRKDRWRLFRRQSKYMPLTSKP